MNLNSMSGFFGLLLSIVGIIGLLLVIIRNADNIMEFLSCKFGKLYENVIDPVINRPFNAFFFWAIILLIGIYLLL